MTSYVQTLKLEVMLSAYGDALIYEEAADSITAMPVHAIKQRVFARHEPSWYGTALEVHKIDEGIEAVVLPAEQVLSFFAELPLLQHIDWQWGEAAAFLIHLAPALVQCVHRRAFHPSLESYQQGHLSWRWNSDQLSSADRARLAVAAQDNPVLVSGLEGAFSAEVSQRAFGSEAEAADLRREYPQLFREDRSGANAAGMDEAAWLIAVGWTADTAPFRPLLQLVEPDAAEGEEHWRLRLMLQDKLDASVLMPVELTGSGEVLGTWPEPWTPHIRERAGSWLKRLSGALPALALPAAASGDAAPAAGQGAAVLFSEPLGSAAAWQFLAADSQRLLQAGWQVLLPAWWEAASRRRPRLRAKVRSGEGSEQSGGRSLFGLDAIVNFDWRIAIGDTDLSEAEFTALAARNERLVHFRDQWIPLDPALVQQIRRAMSGVDKSEGLSLQDVLHLHLLSQQAEAPSDEDQADDNSLERPAEHMIQMEIELNEHLERLIRQLGRSSELTPLPVPHGLQAQLRGYQQEGYTWLALLRRFGLGACLADDMGLGKTVQFIAYLLHIQEEAAEACRHIPSLLICPTSVLGNWQKELSRFAPSLKVMLHYGSKRYSSEEFTEAAMQADLVLTSYATASLDQELLSLLTWESIGLDEAQNIKNAQTKQSMAVRGLPAKHRIALTGTPIENRLMELWSLYDFMNPGYLGTLRGFTNRFIQAIEKERDPQKTADLQRLVHPFMLRRKKKDPAIQLDLPDKNEMKTYIHLTSEQSVLYDHTVQQLMEKMQKLEGIERKGAILSALTRLKQLCDHPILITKEPWPVTEALDLEAGQLDTDRLMNGSAKLAQLLSMVKELRDEGERCLIFTQYIGMGEMLQQVLAQELDEKVLYLNGSTSKSMRDRMIEMFQSTTLPPEEQPNVFILSIKAGGVGLNLTAANHVFHFDRWWNPAVENQATDRAYRMGQTKDVQVHKFISLGTLEERIDDMLESKQQLSDDVISNSEGWITELSTDELRDLFMLRSNWA